jgi:hypothetical protein
VGWESVARRPGMGRGRGVPASPRQGQGQGQVLRQTPASLQGRIWSRHHPRRTDGFGLRLRKAGRVAGSQLGRDGLRLSSRRACASDPFL